MELVNCYDKFMSFKKTYCAAETIEYYEDNIEKFICFVADQENVEFEQLDVTVVDLQLFYDYLYYLRMQHIKNTSLRTYFRAVRTFANWLSDEKYIQDINFSKIKLPKADPAVQVPLTQVEVNVIDCCFDLESILGLRNYCIVHLMLDCGLRSGEVCRLDDRSFDFANNIIYIDGKGYKKRVVPLPEFLKVRLLSYKYQVNTKGAFFRSIRGAALSYNAIKMFLYHVSEESGVIRLHAHLLRHTFATSYVLGGGNLEFLRLLLGHASLDITQRYIHLANTAVIMKQNIYVLDECYNLKAA